MPKAPRVAEASEVGGVFRPGTNPLPGIDGPYPGPWFTLSVGGALYRGRYVENGVWKTESGTRYSQLPQSDSARTVSSPEYATRRLSIVHDLMAGNRHYSPAEIAVTVRNHPETDPREVEILETSQDWSEANTRTKNTRW